MSAGGAAVPGRSRVPRAAAERPGACSAHESRGTEVSACRTTSTVEGPTGSTVSDGHVCPTLAAQGFPPEALLQATGRGETKTAGQRGADQRQLRGVAATAQPRRATGGGRDCALHPTQRRRSLCGPPIGFHLEGRFLRYGPLGSTDSGLTFNSFHLPHSGSMGIN